MSHFRHLEFGNGGPLM